MANAARGLWTSRLTRWLDAQRIRRHEDKVLLLLTLIIGAIVGAAIVGFILVTENLGSRMYPPGGSPWRRLLLPVIGALSTGVFLSRYFPDARGSGIPQTKAALFLRGGFITLRTVLGKFGLSSVSLATGIALGREGPSVQVGAGIASVIGRRLGLSPSRVRALVPIGASAALAAAFNTPIAAVLFSLEEVMGDLHAPVLGSIVLSSATSWIVLHLLLGDEPLFHVPAYQLVHPIEFLIYGILGVVGGLVSVSFVKLLLWLRKRFRRMPKSTEWLQPAAGGLLVGVLGWFVPEVLGVGYGNVSLALNGQIVLGTMALLVVMKVVATATCYASGNAGGIFGPALFIGAMTGGALGGAAHHLLPDYTGSVGAYALVGMGAAFAGIIRVPLTSVIMIFEITRDYSIIVPLMIANLISHFISSRLQEEPIYEALQHQDGVYLPPGAGDREELALVSQGIRPVSSVLREDETVAAAAESTGGVRGTWAVVGELGFLGSITTDQLEEAVRTGRGPETLGRLVPVPQSGDGSEMKYPYVHADEPLDTAMRRLAEAGVDTLPVVSRTNLDNVVGVISLQDVLDVYGFGNRRRPAGELSDEFQAPVAKLVVVVTVIAAMLLLAVSLGYVYRNRRVGRAHQYSQAASELVEDERYAEAVEQYRNALSITHNNEDRLALALTLVKAGRLNEAGIYLHEVLHDHPTSGPANLGLAEVDAAEGRIDEAVNDYHRAVYGAWPAKAAEHRLETRIELAEMLRKSGRSKQAQVELLVLLQELPKDPQGKKRVAHLLLTFGLAQESAEVFRDVLRGSKDDVDAYAGLGDAEVSRWNYRPACDGYRHARRLAPGDQAIRERLDVCEQVVMLDPSLPGLRTTDRYQRSRKLLEEALTRLESCAPSTQESLAESAAQLRDRVRARLAQRRKPDSYGDAADENLAMAKELWKSRPGSCQSSAGSSDALGRVMAHLSR